MDEKFYSFELWYQTNREKWLEQGIIIEKIKIEEKYGHHYFLGLKTNNGLGNIVLYESNNLYWVDFEAGNYNYDYMFMRADIEYDNPKSLVPYVSEFFEYLQK